MRHFIDIHRLKAGGVLLACHLLAGLAHASTLAVAPAAPAAAAKPLARTYTVVGYNRDIKQSDFSGLDKATILKMQNQLKTIYSKLPDWQSDYAMKEQPLSDGIVGRITLSWLQRYGYSFRVATPAGYAQLLPAHIERVASFGSAYPMELGALLGTGFSAWEDQQLAEIKVKDIAVLQRALTPELLELFRRYNAGRLPAQRPSAVAADSGYFTYQLDQEDLGLLQGKDQLLKTLGTLKDKEFHSQDEMQLGLLNTLAGLHELHKSLWPVVKDAARSYDGYLINKAILDKLEKDGFDSDAVDELRGLGTVYLKTLEAFDKFINDKVADGTLKLSEEQIVVLADATRVFDNYHLDEQALETIKNQLKSNVLNAGLPPSVVRMLEQITGVNYPEASVFRSAAISKIDFGLAMCKLNSPTNLPYVAGLRMPDLDVEALEQQLEPLRQQSVDGVSALKQGLTETFVRIRQLRARAQVCDEDTDKESKALVRDLYMSYLGAAIEGVARKKIPDEISELRIKGSKCGCALDNVSRISYAFYPYWKSHKEEQAINFRVLNRIAFQTLTVDNFGNLQRGAESYDVTQNDASENNFVRIAHQHNAKVDWVIQKNDWDGDWRNFTPQGRKVVFGKLRTNILALLTAPLTDTVSKIKNYTTLGLEPKPRRGDGVTLYFPNYPTDPASTADFNIFFTELRMLLDKHDLGLNILVSQNVFTAGRNGGLGAFGLSNLVTLRAKRAATEPLRPGAPGNDEFLLILLNEPSADGKKALRAVIEGDSTLHGSERADFLRSMLPVLHFDNRNWQQLEDDIVYARDSFGGLGLWAPDFDNLAKPVTDPTLSCLKSAELAVCLSRDYREADEEVDLPNALEAFACVERWWLRLALFVLLIIIVTVVVLFFRFCGAQNFLKRNFLWVLLLVNVPATLVFTLLLLYDPLFTTLSSGNLLFIIMAALMMAVMIGGYMYIRKRRRMPVRQRGGIIRKASGFPIIVWTVEVDKGGLRWTLKNTGSGYAVIKRTEIRYDKLPFADVNTALESVLASDTEIRWKSTPLYGKRIEPGGELLALEIDDAAAAQEVAEKLQQKSLVVRVFYSGAGGEHWETDGREVRSISSL